MSFGEELLWRFSPYPKRLRHVCQRLLIPSPELRNRILFFWSCDPGWGEADPSVASSLSYTGKRIRFCVLFTALCQGLSHERSGLPSLPPPHPKLRVRQHHERTDNVTTAGKSTLLAGFHRQRGCLVTFPPSLGVGGSLTNLRVCKGSEPRRVHGVSDCQLCRSNTTQRMLRWVWILIAWILLASPGKTRHFLCFTLIAKKINSKGRLKTH